MAGKKYLLSIDEVNELFLYLSDKLKDCNCDNTLKFTKQWLKETNKKYSGEILHEIENQGGLCDCEVLMNTYRDYELACDIEE